jgi:hypothetical protein
MAELPSSGSDRGSVLLLFPAAFLIVLVLGALAIDAAAVYLRQRDLAAAAGAAANDAAMVGLDLAQLRGTGGLALDPAAVERAVLDSLDRRGVLGQLLEPPTIAVIGSGRVEVSLVAHAPYVIAPALPGTHSGQIVRVTVGADIIIDDGTP